MAERIKKQRGGLKDHSIFRYFSSSKQAELPSLPVHYQEAAKGRNVHNRCRATAKEQHTQ
jgi:hypothetical protein